MNRVCGDCRHCIEDEYAGEDTFVCEIDGEIVELEDSIEYCCAFTKVEL